MNGDKKPRNVRDTDGLFIPNRQLSLLISGGLFLAGCVFMGGYFLGKIHILEPFIDKIEQSSFADQVSTSLHARYDQDIARLCQEEDEDTEMKNVPELALAQDSEEHVSEKVTTQQPIPAVTDNALSQSWYAQLVGYGKEQSAIAFANKLKKKGIPVKVKKYASSTPKGKIRHWYQVITEPFTNRDSLQVVVDRIVHEEKLKDIKVVSL